MKYRTIVADPPWEYDCGFASLWPGGGKRADRTLPYTPMPISKIRAVPVAEFAHDDGCNLFLWTTNHHVPESFGVLSAWGFEYRQMLTWVKTNPAPWTGSVAPISTEFLLFAVRGHAGTQGKASASVVTSPKLAHSQKPEAFLDLVEQVSPGPYLELFARRQRLGWDTWGNEALCHIEMVTR